MRNPFRCFNSSPEVIRLTVMMYIRYQLSLRQVEDLLFERGIDICHETVRRWSRSGSNRLADYAPARLTLQRMETAGTAAEHPGVAQRPSKKSVWYQ